MPKSEKSKSAEVYLDDEKAAEGTKVKKSKGFKRIRGFLKGESRKERKARKEAEKAAQEGTSQAKKSGTSDSGYRSDDGSTVYGVQVDDASVTTGVSNKGPRRSSSRDSMPAGDGRTVSSDTTAGTDNKKGQAAYILKVVLLLMDPASRRFELLQLEFDSLKALVSDVLAQIPISVTEAALREQSYVGICGVDAKDMTSNKLLADFCVGNEVLVAVPSNISPKECVRLARPILSDEKVIAMLKSSGIDASAWRQSKKTPRKGTPSKTKSSDISRQMPDPVQETTEHSENHDHMADQKYGATKQTDGERNEGGKGQGFVVSFFLIIFMTVIIQVFHLYISAPITPGGVVTPGHWLSRCGLYGFVNSSCVDAYLNVNKNGTVTMYDAEKNINWQIEGETCKPKDDECIPGMQFTKERKIVVGGKPISYVTKFGEDAPMSPWPFEEAPLIKTWLKNQKILHKEKE